MFQTFDATTTPDQGPPRLERLRAWMKDQGIHGFLVPRADRHQGEYVAACDERLAWLTGFTGSAGFAVVLEDTAGIFIDGRYRLQVVDQTDSVFIPVHWPEKQLAAWVNEKCDPKTRIGFDPWLHTIAEMRKLTHDTPGIEWVPVTNGIDAIWTDRPAPPDAPAMAHPIEMSGETSGEKCKRIGNLIAVAKAEHAVLTLPDSINWLLNIRGDDVGRTPIVQCFAILSKDGQVDLFGDVAKFEGLGPDPKTTLHPWGAFETVLAGKTGPILLAKDSCPQAVAALLEDSQIVEGDDPCALPKACKNPVELDGARAAHIRDGAAMCRFLAWLDAADTSKLTEIDIVKSLEGFRRADPTLHNISFDTISGSGPNGAIVHYRVTHDTNRTLDTNSLLLVDSGGQYPDGTTDITRTMALGTATDEMKDCFTYVLKGMISLSKTRFPSGLSGRDLDGLARAPLWATGRDYDHGTGHGVGSFLSVHEGPQRISRVSHQPLLEGMIVSNEPGYYKAGAFGIRIENLIIVQLDETQAADPQRKFMSFETLTFVPIDRQLVNVALMNPSEISWLNSYHQMVWDKISPLLSGDDLAWLKVATQAI